MLKLAIRDQGTCDESRDIPPPHPQGLEKKKRTRGCKSHPRFAPLRRHQKHKDDHRTAKLDRDGPQVRIEPPFTGFEIDAPGPNIQ